MLTILPCKDEKTVRKFNPKTDNATALVSKNGDEMIGYIVLEQVGSKIEVIGFELNGCESLDKLTSSQYADVDSLLRSAGSYALNRNVYYINCKKKEYFAMLKQFGFSENDNILTINLQQLFKVCKN